MGEMLLKYKWLGNCLPSCEYGRGFVNSDTSGNNHTKQFLDAEGTYVHHESAGLMVLIQEVNADLDVALPARAVLPQPVAHQRHKL